MVTFDPTAYGPALESLLVDAPLNELGPGRPNRSVHSDLTSLSIGEAFGARKVIDTDMAQETVA